jgi:hypothetical protein
VDDDGGVVSLILGLIVIAVAAIAAWELFKSWLASRQKGAS